MSKLRSEMIAEVCEWYESGFHLDGTDHVFQLEKKLADFYQKSYCLLMSNATTAFLSVALALDLNNGHLIAPSFGWCGTVAPFLLLKNTFSLGDIDANFCLSPSSVEALITPETKAILSIDCGGNAAQSNILSEIAHKHGLYYLSDSAQSLGAYQYGKPAGHFADVIVTSFTMGKTLNAGEGGAILTDNYEIYKKIVLNSQHPYRQKKVVGLSGWNFFSPLNGRIHPLSAIILNENFENVGKILKKRKEQLEVVLKELKQQDPAIHYSSSNSTFFELYLESHQNLPSGCFDSFCIDRDLKSLNIAYNLQKYYPDALLRIENDHLTNILPKIIRITFP